MTDTKNYSGLLVGTIFTIISLLLTITFIVPIISILPGVLFESISKALVSNEPYSKVGKLTILFLAMTLLFALIMLFLDVKRKILSYGSVTRKRIAMWMFIFYFLVHSLGFYIYWGLELDFRSDGQLIFGAVKSFPASSFAFLLIGLLIDLAKNRAANTSIVK